MTVKEFTPDWASPPGDTMADILSERQMSKVQFADLIEQSVSEVSHLLDGTRMITIETAQKLESVLGGSAAFWMIRESQYRQAVERISEGPETTASKKWLARLPLRDMIDYKWISKFSSKSEQFSHCLKYFNVKTVEHWQDQYASMFQATAFRTSTAYQSELGPLAAWLRRAEIEGDTIQCRPWDKYGFERSLSTIRSLTREKSPNVFIPELIKFCAGYGVAVVIVRTPKGCRVSGATRFTSPRKAILALSFRYLSDDHFWFTFFHEAGHLILHGQSSVFLESPKMSSSEQEAEANEFASQVLIPTHYQNELFNLELNHRAIMRFAKKIGISPGIVVGQLQHHGLLGRNSMNGLRRRYSWEAS